MSLFFDAEIPGNEPQTHALVIGIDDYLHLPGGSRYATAPAVNPFTLGQLTSPGRSALAFANWVPQLANRRARIGTVDLMLSPARQADQQDLPTTANLKAAFLRWSQRCSGNPDNVGIFYYCGHGFEDDVTILLPADFGDPGVGNLGDTMIDFTGSYVDNQRESKARTQLYLIDACRETPIDLLRLRARLTSLISTMQLRQPACNAPILQSANPGMKAHAVPGEISYFTQALLACLEKFGARGQNGGRWEVSTNSLAIAMQQYMRRIRVPEIGPLVCAVSGQSNFDTAIHALPGNAYVLSSIDCTPPDALARAEFLVSDGVHAPTVRAPAAEAWELELSAGTYEVGVQFRPPAPTYPAPTYPAPTYPAPTYKDSSCRQLMFPPYTPCTLEVE